MNRFHSTRGRGLRVAGGWLAWSLLLSVVGCADALRQQELERVARDWCMTIRASQVIPVYPLTEDLQPGDVFLVQVPVDEQHRLYRKKGFLSFDNHLERLDPAAYGAFYDHSFSAGGPDAPLPTHWLQPGGDDDAWAAAPDAAFPTYKFSVRTGGGFNMALPIQGVPVGLSLLATDAADGTVTIAQASTYGIDIMSMDRQLRRWAQWNRDFLRNFPPRSQWCGLCRRISYLRVVTRIYLTRELDVSLRDARSFAGGGDVGAPKPVNLTMQDTDADPAKVTIEKYSQRIEQLNAMLESALKAEGGGNLLPGGSMRVVAASAGSITLKQVFNRPLVIGYLAFDVPILDDGELGAPVPTYSMLSGSVAAPTDNAGPFRLDAGADELRFSRAALRMIYESLKDRVARDQAAAARVAALDHLVGVLPDRYPVDIYREDEADDAQVLLQRFKPAGAPISRGDRFVNVVAYWSQLETSVEAMSKALMTGRPIRRHDGTGEAATDVTRDELMRTFDATKQVIDRLREDLFVGGEIREAIDYWQRTE